MQDWIYVDNSNVFIEAKYVSAVQKGMALDVFDAHRTYTLDQAYRLDFGKLYNFVAGNNKAQTARAVLFGSRPPENDAIWKIAEKAGFEVVTEDRNASNKEKKIDTGIVATMMRDAYRNASQGDTFTIVSGDADFVPAVNALIGDGFIVDVVFWGHVSRELREACSNFINLDGHLATLCA